MQALKIAATGMAAQQMRVDVTAHNISNMSTTAFNARRAEFADLHYQQIRTPGTVTAGTGEILPSGVQIGLGVRPASVSMEVRQGSSRQTGGQLDVAIEGDGYIEIELPSGDTAYTRDGSLKLSGEGEVVTSDGYRLLAGITVPIDAKAIEINREGGVYAVFEGEVDVQQIGDIQLASFINDKGLKAVGDNLFLETTASGPPNVGAAGQDGRGTFRQGYIEESSVDVVSEITELIEAQRGYELNSKVLSAAYEMLSTTTRIR